MSPQKADSAPRIEFQVHVLRGRRGRRTLQEGPLPETKAGRESVPRVTRLLALAHRWRGLIDRGEVADQAEIAELMGITRARVTQVVNLSYLSPRIQEALLLSKDCRYAEAELRRAGRSFVWSEQESALE